MNFGLGRLDDAGYIAGMQAINESIPNGVFVLSFLGAPLLPLVTTVLHARSPRRIPLLLATVLIFAGGLFVTFFANAPLNDALATVDLNADRDALAQARAGYEDRWNAWNAVRTVACAAALGCLALALLLPERRPAPTATTG